MFDSKRLIESVQLFRQTRESLDETNPLHHRVMGYALIFENKDHISILPHDGLIQKGVELLRQVDDKAGVVIGLRYGPWFGGVEPGPYVSPFQEGLDLARQYGDPDDIGIMLYKKVSHERNYLPFEVVNQHFQETLEEIRSFGDAVNQQSILFNYGATLVYEGHLEDGIALLEEALDLVKKLDLLPAQAGISADLGFAALKQGQLEKALSYMLQARNIARSFDYALYHCKALGYLGRIELKRGNQSVALDYLQESLELAESNLQLSENLLGVAEYYKAQNELTKAVSLLEFLMLTPDAEKREKDQARAHLKELEGVLSRASFEAALESSKTLTFDKVVQEALSLTT